VSIIVSYISKFIGKIKSIPNRVYNLHLFSQDKVTMHCIGDSHLCVYRYILKHRLLKKTMLKFCVVGGATLSGIENPNSKTQAGPIISRYLDNKVRSNHVVLVCLGEVDCGFVIWYQAEKYNEDIDIYFQKALDNYCVLLMNLQSKSKRVIASSIPLPTIKDGVTGGWVAQARGEIKASVRQRTNLTMRFNRGVKMFCAENNLDFLDLESYIINKNTMLLDEKYLNSNERDHHLSDSAYAPVVINELQRRAVY